MIFGSACQSCRLSRTGETPPNPQIVYRLSPAIARNFCGDIPIFAKKAPICPDAEANPAFRGGTRPRFGTCTDRRALSTRPLRYGRAPPLNLVSKILHGKAASGREKTASQKFPDRGSAFDQSQRTKQSFAVKVLFRFLFHSRKRNKIAQPLRQRDVRYR